MTTWGKAVERVKPIHYREPIPTGFYSETEYGYDHFRPLSDLEQSKRFGAFNIQLGEKLTKPWEHSEIAVVGEDWVIEDVDGKLWPISKKDFIEKYFPPTPDPKTGKVPCPCCGQPLEEIPFINPDFIPISPDNPIESYVCVNPECHGWYDGKDWHPFGTTDSANDEYVAGDSHRGYALYQTLHPKKGDSKCS